MDAIKLSWTNNKTLGKYDFKHNNITDDGVEKMMAFLPDTPHIFEVEVSEWIN